jgi:hypothetical protein
MKNGASIESYVVECVFVSAVTFLPSRCVADIDWFGVGVMKYAVKTCSSGMINIPSFMRIGSGIDMLIGQTA